MRKNQLQHRILSIVALQLLFNLPSADASKGVRFATPSPLASAALFERIDNSSRGLGISYKDPNGVVWSDLLKTPMGTFVVPKSHADASAKCRALGARLPTNREIRELRGFFGGAGGSMVGYEPQILENVAGPYLTYFTYDGWSYRHDSEYYSEMNAMQGSRSANVWLSLIPSVGEAMGFVSATGAAVRMEVSTGVREYIRENRLLLAIRCVYVHSKK